MTEEARLSSEERTALWQQYARVHASVQETFDSSVRALAAGGVAVTVTIATAAGERFDGWAGQLSSRSSARSPATSGRT